MESVGIEFHSRNVLGTRRKRRAKCRDLSPWAGCADTCWHLVYQTLCTSQTSVLLDFPLYGAPAAFFTTTATPSAQPARWPLHHFNVHVYLFDLFRSSSIFLPGSRMVPPSHHDPRPRQTTSHSCGHLDYFSLCWFRTFYCSHVRKVIRGRWSWPVLHTEKRFFSNFPEPANRAVCTGMVKYLSAFEESQQRIFMTEVR